MKKRKLYLDTSTISNLYDTDDFRLRESNLLWDEIKAGKYEVYLSDTAFEELNRCQQPKLGIMYNFLDMIEFVHLGVNDNVKLIADEVIRTGVLTAKHRNDCLHIGYAIDSECDFLISWNFDDLANVDTNKGVRDITTMRGLKSIEIISPSNIIKREV